MAKEMSKATIEYITKPQKDETETISDEVYDMYGMIFVRHAIRNKIKLRGMKRKPVTESTFVKDFTMEYADNSSKTQPVSISTSKVWYKNYFAFCLIYFWK